MPTVSVVVPCYKYGQFVTECVTSILANTEVDLDILVIDDASPDDSWEVVKRLPELDPRIRVHRNERNLGLIGTANSGVMAATGDYVVLISADDALAPGWLDRSVAHLESHPEAVLAYGNVKRFAGPLPKPRGTGRDELVVYPGHEWNVQNCARGVTPTLSPEVIVRTSAHHRVGPYRHDLPYSSDMEMWMRLASIGDILFIGGPVGAYYRVSASSMSRAVYMDPLREVNVRRDAFHAWYEFADGLVPDRDELLAKAKNTLARTAIRRAYLAFWQDPGTTSQFDSACKFALDTDPEYAAGATERLTALRDRPWMSRLRRVLRPLTRGVVRARFAAADVRLRLRYVRLRPGR
jgi:glycosyltransferase involved in cell wall biosynthesis